MNETLELQKELDPTTGAKAHRVTGFPVAIKWDSFTRSLLLSEHKEIRIDTYEYSSCPGYTYLQNGKPLIPLTDFISELEQLIAEVKLAHGLTPIEWSFP